MDSELVEGDLLTRAEIAARFGGNPQAALPDLGGLVVAICLKPEIDRRAPEMAFIAQGPIRERNAAALVNQVRPAPLFIECDDQAGTGRYFGQYRAVEYDVDPIRVAEIVEPYQIDFEAPFVGILRLEKVVT